MIADQQITLAILLGSDYSPGVRGLGLESACRIVKSVGDKAVLQQIASEGLLFVKNLKGSRKLGCIVRCSFKENDLDHEMNINGSEHNRQEADQFLQVIDAYLKPKCHSADSEAVYRVLTLHPFQRSKLQQICAQFFEWPPEKTDEYILPKIAERNLRRFVNLRSTSSELGVCLPLDKMPVKCPVSGIIKQRKVHGQECFEVSWEEVHGLNSSIVPADLIKSACPEKILEFEQRAQEKKQNHRKPRPKKSENRAPMQDIDLNLQDLLLDIEHGSSASQKASLSAEAISKKRNAVTKVDQMNQNPPPFAEFEGIIERNTASVCCPKDSNVSAMEVIDLLSPSPPRRGHVVPKCQQTNIECIEMIDLSESETESSPEHAKKARELRLFLDSIREDLY
ncbi:hypothetical protein U1Q18_004506 [Sarracenia purpurea var. burkii]